jgi:hypothetical protein
MSEVHMERRSEERHEVRFETKVTPVNDRSRTVLCRLSNISESGISVDLPFQLASGDAVELELADSTLYGQVVYSKPEDSAFRTGIRASRVALGGTGLSTILQRVLIKNLPLTLGLEPTEVRLG